MQHESVTPQKNTPYLVLAVFESEIKTRENKDNIVRAMNGIDVVISALNTDDTTTLSESMPLIIEAMESEGIKRIITIGTAGILQSRTTPNSLRYQSSESKQKSTRAAKEHHKGYDLLKQSTLLIPLRASLSK